MRTDESSSTSMVSPKSPLSLPFPSRVVLTKIYSRPIVHTRVFVFLVLMNQIFPAQVCGMNRHAKARRTSITSTNRWSRTEYASRLMPHKPASFQLVVSLCKNSISSFFLHYLGYTAQGNAEMLSAFHIHTHPLRLHLHLRPLRLPLSHFAFLRTSPTGRQLKIKPKAAYLYIVLHRLLHYKTQRGFIDRKRIHLCGCLNAVGCTHWKHNPNRIIKRVLTFLTIGSCSLEIIYWL